jgi:hypothetical protein
MGGAKSLFLEKSYRVFPSQSAFSTVFRELSTVKGVAIKNIWDRASPYMGDV